MLSLSIFLFLSAAAIAMYFAASIQFLELVFDHYYRYAGLGLAIFGLTLGFALSASGSEKGVAARIASSPVVCVFIAAIGQLLAWYAAFHMTYGTGWVFMLLMCALLVPYVFGGCVFSRMSSDSGISSSGNRALVVGAASGLFAALWLVDYINSLSAVWLLSSSLLALSVLPLAGKRSSLQGLHGIWVAAALLWLATISRIDVYPQWDMSRGTVSKPIAAALANQKELQIESTQWRSGYRLDRISSKRGRKDGFGWNVVNATAPVPFAYGADAHPFEWWLRRFPLAALPLSVAEPARMLSIGPARGPDAHMAALVGVRTYEYQGDVPRSCDGKVKLQCLSGIREGVLAVNAYDLIHLSVPHPLKSAWVGANSLDETLVSEEMLKRYFAALDDDGMLAITAREEALFMKLLISVWTNLLPDSASNVMDLEDRMSVFRLNQYAPYKGSFRYLMLVAREAFSAGQLERIEKISSRIPVEAIIYRNQVHKAPYRGFDNSMVSISLEDVQKHFTRFIGFTLQSPVNLGAASLEKPGFFHLSMSMHPFLRWLLTGVLAMMAYGVLFSFREKRSIEHPDQSKSPAVSAFLVQLLASAAGAVFLFSSILPPAIAVMQIPLRGFLLAVTLVLVAVFCVRRSADASGGNHGQKAVIGSIALILAFLLCVYVLREKAFDYILADRNLFLLGMALLLGFAFAWLSWRIHQRLIKQAQQAHSLALPWVWTLTGLGVLAGFVVSTQAWLQAGWSRVIFSACVSYFVVIAIEIWIARSSPTSGQPDVAGQTG